MRRAVWFVGGVASESGPVVVMLDGELNGDVIDLEQLQPVTITNVQMHLDGPDLIEDPELRRGLVHLWQAEAETAGLDVDSMQGLGAGQQLPDGSWSLAAITSGPAKPTSTAPTRRSTRSSSPSRVAAGRPCARRSARPTMPAGASISAVSRHQTPARAGSGSATRIPAPRSSSKDPSR